MRLTPYRFQLHAQVFALVLLAAYVCLLAHQGEHIIEEHADACEICMQSDSPAPVDHASIEKLVGVHERITFHDESAIERVSHRDWFARAPPAPSFS
ncbi:MAG: hypothetical protein ACR2RB_19720 [Gammaproteobacteria bacterium]